MGWNSNHDYFWIYRIEETVKRSILFLTFILIIFISIILFIFLIKEKDPNKPPSALLDKETPEFELINLFDENENFSKKDFKNKKVLINFFASWCTPCKKEHPLLMKIKNNNNNSLIIVGVDFKDKKEDALKFLLENGNPYHFVGFDDTGSVGLEFGVFGLPETFIINNDGKIIYKHIGPITKKILSNEILPLLK